ncbi:GntR family transcriptional regulator [Roseivivax sp.]
MEPSPLGIARPKSLTELVTERLRARIISGELELGQKLSEARIAKQMEVSRTPVREAVNRLESEGLLRVEAQRGCFVFEVGPDELGQLCDARVCIETQALQVALRTDPRGLHTALSACVEDMRRARAGEDTSAYLAFDTDFHDLLVAGSKNPFLIRAYAAISPKMAALRNRLGRHIDHMAKSFEEHVIISDCVRRGDAETGLEVLVDHIGRKEGTYWELFHRKTLREANDKA